MKTRLPSYCSLLIALFAFNSILFAQPTSDSPLASPENGPRHNDPSWHALINTTVHVSPGEVLEHATVVMRDGIIVSVLAGQPGGVPPAAPAGAQLHNASGLHIYPGLIDAWVPVDADTPYSDHLTQHWNSKVHPSRSALLGAGLDKTKAQSLRKMGFVAAAIAPRDGIFKGTSAIISLSDPAETSSAQAPVIYKDRAYHALAFERGSRSPSLDQAYPSSLMGAIALVRQTLMDAQWQARAHGRNPQLPQNALDTLTDSTGAKLPLVFDVKNELEVLRATEIGKETSRSVIILGSGMEFRRLDAIAQTNTPIILPLRFPAKPDVSTVGRADAVDLRTLMTWEQAPTNPYRLIDAGLTVAITTGKLPKKQSFMDNLRRAIKVGLSEPDALAMLTITPAEMLGIDETLGTVEVNKAASLVVADGPLFDKDTKIRDVWIQGRRYEINPAPGPKLDGAWTLRVGENFSMALVFDGNTIKTQEEETKGKARKVKLDANTVSFLIDDEDDSKGSYTLSGVFTNNKLIGTGISPDGHSFQWTATRDQPIVAADKNTADQNIDEADNDDLPPEDLPGYPFGPYASPSIPEQQTVIFTNATIWTSSPDNIINNDWIVIEEGKIIALGTGPIDVMTKHDPVTIDLNGAHITPGLIDAHSHTGLFAAGVNEGTQASTAEVRIADDIDPDHINWYRQLAGGITTVNSLHGSANPVGGQSQTHKVRWGVSNPNDMRFQNAKPGIKFALGENVKQSNWGSRFTTRYPQTRMGVESFYLDRFTAARAYAKARAEYEDIVQSIRRLRITTQEQNKRIATLDEPRRDLELDILAQILSGDRLIHCHSYRQDEILMLARVAQSFGFKIGTFQHILEGYKVADIIKETAIGASSFSDWWAYKFEVVDAIPYNGAIMHDVGVVVSFNSDSDELARRMNSEAAKAVAYGGLNPSEALKFVTINPAIQLGIDKSAGSLEVGKDADLAIWSGDPLSTLSRCTATWIDGREYFSLQRDAAFRQQITAERQRIIQKLLAQKKPTKSDSDDEDKETEPESNDDKTPEQYFIADQVRKTMMQRYLNNQPTDSLDCSQCDTNLSIINH